MIDRSLNNSNGLGQTRQGWDTILTKLESGRSNLLRDLPVGNMPELYEVIREGYNPSPLTLAEQNSIYSYVARNVYAYIHSPF